MSQLRRKFLTHEGIRSRLIKAIAESGLSATQWAIKHEVSTTMVSRALNRKGETGHRLMEVLGVEQVPHFAVRLKPQEKEHAETEPSEDDNDDQPETKRYESSPLHSIHTT